MTLERRYKNRITGKAMDFLKGAMAMSPDHRFSAEECLMHPYFEDLRLKDPELNELTKNFDQGRIESTKAHTYVTDAREFTGDRRASNKSNNIRIKTVTDNPMQEVKRKSMAQGFGVPKVTTLNFSEDPLALNTNKSQQKTYLKFYESNTPSLSTEPKFNVKQNLPRRKDLPAYTQYNFAQKSQDERSEIKVDNRRKTNNQFKFETNSNGYKNSTSTSLSQIHRKYNFSTSRKFGSREGKERIGQSHTFGFRNHNNQGLRYDNFDTFLGNSSNQIGGQISQINTIGQIPRQLPQIHKKNVYTGSYNDSNIGGLATHSNHNNHTHIHKGNS